MYDLLSFPVYVLSGILATGFAVLSVSGGGKKNFAAVILAAVTGLASAYFLADPLAPMFAELGVSAVATLYRRIGFFPSVGGFIIVLACIFLGLSAAIWTVNIITFASLAAAAMLVDPKVAENEITNLKMKGKDRNKEVRRDYFQVALGVAVIAASMVLGLSLSRYGMFLSVLAMLFTGNLISMYPKSYASRKFFSMERDSVMLGLGAIWIAIASLLAVALSPNIQSFELCITVIFISDAVATIVGVKYGKTSLIAGGRKSVEGFLSHVALSSVAGLILLGYAGAILGVLSAVIESLSQGRLDDNLTAGGFIAIGVYLASLL